MEVPGYSSWVPIYRGRTHQVLRGRRASDGRAVVLKALRGEFPDPGAVASLLREAELLDSLQLEGVCGLLEVRRIDGLPALVLQDVGATSLADLLREGPLALPRFEGLARALVTALAGLHDAGVVHRDLNPHNIIIDGDRVTIVDLGLAVRFVGTAPAGGSLAGTVAYISPEQTGRTGLEVDERSDLYSLGATLFEALAGRPPFEARTPRELVHAQLARVAPPLRGLRPEISERLSRIVARLLAKRPEDRYQNAWGLLADLGDSGASPGAPLGLHDRPRRLLPPGRVAGREGEYTAAREALDSALQGRATILWITGDTGSGKSRLLAEVREPAAAQRVLWGDASFGDRSSAPLTGLLTAIDAALGDVLGSLDPERERVRQSLHRRLGPSAELLAGLLPALAQLLRIPASSAATPGAHARLHDGLVDILATLASDTAGLVLALDDAHQADEGTLRVLADVFARLQGQRLLLAVVAQDSDLDADHPLQRWRSNLPGDAGLVHVALHPLDERAVVSLVADVLRVGPDEASLIGSRVRTWWGGNPLAVMEGLRHLERRGTLIRRPGGGWAWNEDLLDLSPPGDGTDSHVEVIEELSDSSRPILAVAAILGVSFELTLLADLLGRPVREAAGALDEALRIGLLLPVGSNLGPLGQHADERTLRELRPMFRFAHDGHVQALLDGADEEVRQQTHRAAAQLLADRGDAPHAAVEHLLGGGPRVAQEWAADGPGLALQASVEALARGAPEAAERYARAGLGWSAPDDRALRRRLHLQVAAALAARGQVGGAEAQLAAAEPLATTPLARAAHQRAAVSLAVLSGNHERALALGRAAAAGLGIDLSDPQAMVAALLPTVLARLAAGEAEALSRRPPASDADLGARMDLLDALIPSAFFTDQELFTATVLTMVELTLDHGVGPRSGYPMTFVAILVDEAGDPRLARRVAQTGVELAEGGDPGSFARAQFTFGHHLQHWTGPARDNLAILSAAEQSARAAGDQQWAGYAMAAQVMNQLPAGTPLAELGATVDRALPYLQGTGNVPMVAIAQSYGQAARCLRGQTWDRSFDDVDFDEDAHLRGAAAAPTIEVIHRVVRQVVSYLIGDSALSLDESERAEALLPFVRGNLLLVEHALYAGLAWADQARVGSHRADARVKAADYRERLARWANVNPDSFGPHLRLLDGALHESAGTAWEALEAYDDAASLARRGGLLREAALASERAARMLLREGRRLPAVAYARAAHGAWTLWGATLLADDVQGRFHELADDSSPRQSSSAGSSSENSRGGALDRLDLSAVVDAAETFASERVQADATRRILDLIVELAGASRGVLVLDRGGELIPVAERRERYRSIPPDEAEDAVARTIVDHVADTREPLVLDDARANPRFRWDPWLTRHQPRSLLAIPALRQGRTVAVFVLENDLVESAFAGARVRLLSVLGTLAAVALENAALFEAVQHETGERLEAERRLQQAQRLESVGRLASGVAHDFNNLLGVILGWSQLVLDDPETTDVAEALEQISGAAERGARLTRQLLAFSRSTAARPETVDLPRAVSSLAHMLSRLLGDAVELTVADAPAELPGAFVDPGLLEQVIVNLAVNARDALDDGGTISIRFELRHDPPGLAAGEYVALLLTDDGVGIPPELMDRIFDPFFTTKEVNRGTGLGLSTCLGIVEQSGGRLSVQSQLGLGTTFEVLLPASATAVDDDEAATPTGSQPRAGHSVLFAEDEPTLRRLVATMLRRMELNVVEAADGVEALEALQAGTHLDLLLTDFTMPGMDGLTLAGEARRLRPDLAIAILSGTAEALADQLPADLSDVTLLQKPIRPSQLGTALSVLLDRPEGADASLR